MSCVTCDLPYTKLLEGTVNDDDPFPDCTPLVGLLLPLLLAVLKGWLIGGGGTKVLD